MKKWLLIIERELKLSFFKKGYFFNILSFFLIISFSFAMVAGLNDKMWSIASVLLISYVITAIFSSPYVLEDDYKDSSLTQLLTSGYSAIFIITAKTAAYFLILFITAIINIVLCALIYNMNLENLVYIFIAFTLISLVLSSLTLFASSLTIKTKKNDLVNFLISMPLLIIFLLYSSSILNNLTMQNMDYVIFITDLKILVSITLILVPISLYACSYIIQKI